MLAQEIKESLRALAPTELLELKRLVDEQCAAPVMDRNAKIAKAKQEIFTEYDSLLNELAK